MDKLIKKICDDVLKKYQQDKNILGIMLFGSATRNKFDEYSDVDIYVLEKNKSKQSRYNFLNNGYRVDIILDSLKEVNSYLKKDKRNIKRITSHMLAYGKIIFQRDNILQKIQNCAINNLKSKTKHNNEEILMHKYSIDDFWGEVQRDIKNKDYLAFGIDSYLLINNIIELIVKLNGKFLRQPNEITKLLDEIDKNFGGQIQKFYKISKIEEKEKILANLVKYSYKKSGGMLPPEWSIK